MNGQLLRQTLEQARLTNTGHAASSYRSASLRFYVVTLRVACLTSADLAAYCNRPCALLRWIAGAESGHAGTTPVEIPPAR